MKITVEIKDKDDPNQWTPTSFPSLTWGIIVEGTKIGQAVLKVNDLLYYPSGGWDYANTPTVVCKFIRKLKKDETINITIEG